MNNIARNCVVLEQIEQLQTNGSWCGETHVQKAVYFLQELTGVQAEFSYVLYKHGPFSFDLRDELSALTANRLVEWSPQIPYGPKCHVTSYGKELLQVMKDEIEPHKSAIVFLSNHLATEKVAELERLGTALYFIKCEASLDDEALAEKVHERKPHISYSEAYQSVKRVKELQTQWASAA